MPLAQKVKTSELPEGLYNQISNNFKKDDTLSPTEKEVTNVLNKTENESQAKSKYSDSVNLRLTSGKRNEFKKFFTDCEISMNQGFEMAVDFIMREARAGRIHVSKSGITKEE